MALRFFGRACLLGWGALSFALIRGSGTVGLPVSTVLAGELERGDVKLTAEPRRIVTAALLPEELLAHVLEPERWVGISYVVDWPSTSPAAARFPKTSHRITGSAEAILSLAPDLVILSDYSHPSTEILLSNANVPVWRVRAARNVEELLGEWRRLGEVVHRSFEVGELIKKTSLRYEKLTATVPGYSVLFLQGRYAYAEGAIQAACPKRAGFRNVLRGDARGSTPQISDEELAVLRPDFVFLAAPVDTPTEVPPGGILPGLPQGVFHEDPPHVFLFPEVLMGSISQFVIDACEQYVSVANRVRG
jgi:ABC-type Fe3+-hydroxamate transport system substrate-binding protein